MFLLESSQLHWVEYHLDDFVLLDLENHGEDFGLLGEQDFQLRILVVESRDGLDLYL